MGAPQDTFKNNQAPQCEDKHLNAFTEEINNAIVAAGLTLSDTDKAQLAHAMINTALSGTLFDYSGTANAIVLSPKAGKSAPKKYYDGMRVMFLASSKNTGNVTVNLAGLGVKPINKTDGSDLDAGDIDGFVEISYQQAHGRFVLAFQSNPGVEDSELIPKAMASYNATSNKLNSSKYIDSVTDNGSGNHTFNVTPGRATAPIANVSGTVGSGLNTFRTTASGADTVNTLTYNNAGVPTDAFALYVTIYSV